MLPRQSRLRHESAGARNRDQRYNAKVPAYLTVFPFSRWREKVPKADEGGPSEIDSFFRAPPSPGAPMTHGPLPPAGGAFFYYFISTKR